MSRDSVSFPKTSDCRFDMAYFLTQPVLLVKTGLQDRGLKESKWNEAWQFSNLEA